MKILSTAALIGVFCGMAVSSLTLGAGVFSGAGIFMISASVAAGATVASVVSNVATRIISVGENDFLSKTCNVLLHAMTVPAASVMATKMLFQHVDPSLLKEPVAVSGLAEKFTQSAEKATRVNTVPKAAGKLELR